MKKVIYSLLLCTCVFVAATSCQDDNDKFELSAAQRLQKAQTEAVNVLQAAKNGWIMQYYSDTATAGGFTVLAKFDDQMNVTISGESVIANTHEEVTSQYEMIGDRGPVLSFATYNKIFHLFSDPQQDGLGMQGDYEFMVLETSPERMILQGKKRNARIIMTPFPETETWENYLNKIDAMNKAFTETSPYKWQVFINRGSEGEDTLQVSINKYRTMQITRSFILDETTTDQPQLIGTRDTEELSTCFIITPEGLETYNPLLAGKDTIYKFVWDATNAQMVASNKRMEAIKMTPLELFSISEDSWIIDTLDMATTFSMYYNAAAQAIKEQGNYDDSFSFVLGFSYFPQYGPVMYFTPVSGRTQGLLFTEYVLTDPDIITIGMADSQYSREGMTTYNQVSEFENLITYLMKNFRIEADNDANPSVLRFFNTFGTKRHVFTLKKYGGNTLFTFDDENQ